jgi:ArsR family transcriptional regulator
MGTSKAEKFDERQQTLALMLKALSHPARIAILEYLLSVDQCICGDIVNELPLAQPTVSQHLKEMKQAGLIKGRIDGKSICYCVDHDAMNQISAFFTQVAEQSKRTNSSCC